MTMLNVHLPSGRGALIRASAAAIFAALAATALTAVREVRAQTVAVQPEGVITDFIVKYDQSQIFDLSRPAAEIIVGNPIIADVQAQSNTTLIVTGKTFGVTNLIILDAERKKIAEHRIIVTRDNVRTLNLWRSTLRRSYNCVGGEACNPSLVVGDDVIFFKNVVESSKGKITFSGSATDPAGGGAGAGGSGGDGGQGPGGSPQ
jgi:hypothetical protein